MENKKVRILIDHNMVLVIVGDPSNNNDEVSQEILDIINNYGHVLTVNYEQYLKLRLFEKVDFSKIF